MKKNFTKKVAKELSVKKWEWIVKHKGRPNYEKMIADIPELKDILFNCGYCHKYYEKKKCIGCPINIFNVKNDGGSINGCHANRHPFSIWSEGSCKLKPAMNVLELVKSAK